MKKIKVLVIGSGGHAKSCIEIIEQIKQYKIIGLIDNNPYKKIDNYKVLFHDNEFEKIKKITKNLVIGVGYLKHSGLRKKIYLKYKKRGFNFPIIVAKNAVISSTANIREGSIIFNNVIINRDAKIGLNCLINNNCLIEHDTIVKNNCHISTSVTVNGNSIIEENCFIGSGSVINNNLKVKKNSFIKMGSVLKN